MNSPLDRILDVAERPKRAGGPTQLPRRGKRLAAWLQSIGVQFPGEGARRHDKTTPPLISPSIASDFDTRCGTATIGNYAGEDQ